MKLKRFNKNENREEYILENKISEDEKKFKIIEKLSKNWSEKLKQEYLVPKALYNFSLNELKKIADFYLNESFHMSDETPISIDNEHKSISTKPKIFSATKYDLPSDDDLIDINNFELSSDDIINGFSYTIIGRGIIDDKKKQDIYKSIEMLSEKFPENKTYKEALNKIKDKYNIGGCTICDTIAELKENYLSHEAVENIRVEEDNDKNIIVFDCKCETDIQGVNEYNGFEIRYNLLCSINDNVFEKSEEEIILEARKYKELLINDYLEEIKKS